MHGDYMMIAAFIANNQKRDREEFGENPLSTREMAAVQQPRARFAPITALRNRFSRR